MTREEQKVYNAENYPASVLVWLNEATDRAYDNIEANHKYIIKLIAHTAGSNNKAISQTLLTIDGILKEMMEQKC